MNQYYILFYLLAVNLFGFGLMLYDKQRARAGEWRVPEKRLFTTAWVGGAIGVWLGMRVVRHKTKHWTFVIGIPCLMVLNVVLIYPMAYFGPFEWLKKLGALIQG